MSGQVSGQVSGPAVPDGVMTVVVMGVSGSGKSTIGALLASRRGWVFAEGDEFHPPANIAKMRNGVPLDDADRMPWLRSVARWIGLQERGGRDAVVTCSALRRSYRDLLREGNHGVWFVHVTASHETLRWRTENRVHYMPAALLPSQLATLEPLGTDEPGVQVENDGPPAEVVDLLLQRLAEARALRGS